MEKLKSYIESAVTGLDAIKRAPIVDFETNLHCLRIQDVSQSKEVSCWGYTNAHLEGIESFIIKKDDTFVARTGSTIGCNFFSKRDLNSVFNNGLIRLRTNSKMIPRFLGYLVQTNDFRKYVNNVSMSSATQPNIKINDLLDYDLVVPELDKQQHIVDTIGSVDDLIENYQSQSAKICSLLVKSLEKYNKKCLFKEYNPKIIKSGIYMFDNSKEYIDTSSIEGINNFQKGEIITYTKRPSRANMQPLNNSVWFAKMKGSYKVILVNNDFEIINKMILSTGFMGIIANKELPLSLLFAIIISNEFTIQRDIHSVGTTMAGVNNETFINIEVPFLSYDERTSFEYINRPFIDKLSRLRIQINELKEIKNSLLKKYF